MVAASRSRRAAFCGGHDAQPARDDAADRFAGFRVARERGVLHALANLVSAHCFVRRGRNRLVGVDGHGWKIGVRVFPRKRF